jgi:hypothetical protein
MAADREHNRIKDELFTRFDFEQYKTGQYEEEKEKENEVEKAENKRIKTDKDSKSNKKKNYRNGNENYKKKRTSSFFNNTMNEKIYELENHQRYFFKLNSDYHRNYAGMKYFFFFFFIFFT